MGVRGSEDDFEAGTYYVKVTAPASDTTYPVPYTIHAYEDAEYTESSLMIALAATTSLNNPGIDDPLYGCQWHLNNREGQDINVEAVWTEGIDGEGVNIAVVDETVDYSHEDLAENIDSSLNHDYGGMGAERIVPSITTARRWPASSRPGTMAPACAAWPQGPPSTDTTSSRIAGHSTHVLEAILT